MHITQRLFSIRSQLTFTLLNVPTATADLCRNLKYNIGDQTLTFIWNVSEAVFRIMTMAAATMDIDYSKEAIKLWERLGRSIVSIMWLN